ncbi:MAG TPA: CPBP family intramembrane glutamic endopeptidase [Symbiobacteriaceae bacterium]|nr:CPBP family intramembrane glutamic endopeptidase [Symbiobacteriaceae bacterium]
MDEEAPIIHAAVEQPTQPTRTYPYAAPLLAAVAVNLYGYAYLQTTTFAWLLASLVTGLLVLLLCARLPHLRGPLVQSFGATAILFLALRFYPVVPLMRWIRNSVQGSPLGYWLIEGPGGGLLGQLPAAVLMLLTGRWVFGLSWADQTGARSGLSRHSWFYGAIVGVGISLVTIGLAWATGQGHLSWQFNWASAGVNLYTNLLEEIIARGMLLQVVRSALGDTPAVIWTGVVFGLMHGFGPKGLFIAALSWSLGWAVLRSKSLWGGWIGHQLSDLIIDSLLH